MPGRDGSAATAGRNEGGVERTSERAHLVDDDVLPRESLQMLLLSQDHLVTGDTDVELLVDEPVMDELLALVLGALQDEHVNVGSPLLELLQPVVQGGLGDDDQMRTQHGPKMAQIANQRDSLQSLPQSHLVGKDARDSILVQGDQPVEARNLIVPHLSTVNEGGGVSKDDIGRASLSVALEELAIFFGLGPTEVVTGSTPGAFLARFRSVDFLVILTVDLGHDPLDGRVGAEFDEVTEQIGQAKEVAKTSNRVTLL